MKRWGTLLAVAAIMGLALIFLVHATKGSQNGAGTVTYTVDGSAAHVTYGPAGSQLAGSVPMRATSRLGGAAYYSVWAQLQSTGSVSCQIAVNGQVISRGQATASYGVARCEISQSGGQWVSDTG